LGKFDCVWAKLRQIWVKLKPNLGKFEDLSKIKILHSKSIQTRTAMRWLCIERCCNTRLKNNENIQKNVGVKNGEMISKE